MSSGDFRSDCRLSGKVTVPYMRKILKFLSSMQFALILLLVLAAACAFGSFITQGQTLSWYTTSYGERAAAAIMLFGLDDVFHSV